MLKGKGFTKMFAFLLLIAAMSSGCVAATRLIDYRELKSDVKITQSIFLTATEAPKTVYAQIRNTSSNQDVTEPFTAEIINQLTTKGYQMVKKPSQATYILQANVRYLGEWKDNMNLADTAIGAGVGALSGIGLTRPSSFNNLGTNALGGAAIGAAIGFAADAATKVKTEVVTIDLQIVERPEKGKENKYTAGIAARADQLSASFDTVEATKMLLTTAAKQISGVF